MHKKANDNIVAIATPIGRGGVGIVRISGPDALGIAEKITQRHLKPRFAHHCQFYAKHELIDEGIAIFFPAPNSFTGEMVVELQAHGSPIVLDQLLQAVIAEGARLAQPGEFSQRAFLNDKIDLAQAEAIADLINASSQQAARSALRSLCGEFSNLIHDMVAQLTTLRLFIEASIDFVDEDIEFINEEKISQQLAAISMQLEKILKTAQQGVLLKQGISVVIAGPPNAGKSSLLNALTQNETAIVTEIPGTTRDLIQETIQIAGVPLHIIDTAGIRESQDVVEQIGIERAKEAMARADILVYMFAADEALQLDDPELLELFSQQPTLVIRNKIDKLNETPNVQTGQHYVLLSMSAKLSQGVDLLKDYLLAMAGFDAQQENVFIARRRHLTALINAQHNLTQAAHFLNQAQLELAAEELRLAQQSLGEITGEVTADDLLGKIFSEFCIGK